MIVAVTDGWNRLVVLWISQLFSGVVRGIDDGGGGRGDVGAALIRYTTVFVGYIPEESLVSGGTPLRCVGRRRRPLRGAGGESELFVRL